MRSLYSQNIQHGPPFGGGHVGGTCATTHIPSFITVTHTEIWISAFFVLLTNQNKYANEVLNMRIRWRQTTWIVISLYPPLPTYRILWKSVIAFSLEKWKFSFLVDDEEQPPYRQHDNRNLSGPSSIVGGPQKCMSGWREQTHKEINGDELEHFNLNKRWTFLIKNDQQSFTSDTWCSDSHSEP